MYRANYNYRKPSLLCRLSLLVQIAFSFCLLIVFLQTPIEQVSRARATSWVVNAFVLATPISGPACVKKVRADSLVMLDSEELHMQSVSIVLFISFAVFRASSVSAVSPL